MPAGTDRQPAERGSASAQSAPAAGARVLIVEDDREIAELIAAYLGRDGCIPLIVGSTEEGLARATVLPPDLVLLDLGLPGASGLEFLRSFREWSTAPVIIVSARESDEDKIAGLGLGADDFVTKPFSPRELAARVRAQLRRASAYGDAAASLAQAALDFGPYRLDYEGRLLLRRGAAAAPDSAAGADSAAGGPAGAADAAAPMSARVPLSRREFELLAFLARNPGRSFSPEELFRSVWGLEHGDLSTVAVHIQRIRRKIEEDPSSPRWIETVPGAGYRFSGGEKQK